MEVVTEREKAATGRAGTPVAPPSKFTMTLSQPKFVFDLSGGNLALDFANTVSERPMPHAMERLNGYRDLVFFGKQSGVLPPRTFERLYMMGAEATEPAEQVLREAIRLREALFAIFSAVAERRPVPANALALLTMAAQNSARYGRLVHKDGRFRWEWVGMDAYLESVLWPVTRAAVDLLLSEELMNLRICASDTCAWLFLDKTKNHRRRWCDMKVCGNRVKAKRHYERAKGV
jgi:predicted RNA-binding Zn ribbon-like protein